MRCALHMIVSLFVLSISVRCLSNPPNSHVLGNSWFCDTGYKRVDDRCVKLQVPENASVSGNSWYCDTGYKRVDNICVKMTQDEIDQLDALKRERLARMSDGTAAYATRVDSDNGDILKLENGAVVEITSGFVGFIGFRKRAVLFGSGSRCEIWIEGKRVFRCDLLKQPIVRARPAMRVHISEVKYEGAVLIMLDGSKYEVDEMDRISTALWLGISDGLLINGTELFNFDAAESVTVYRLL